MGAKPAKPSKKRSRHSSFPQERPVPRTNPNRKNSQKKLEQASRSLFRVCQALKRPTIQRVLVRSTLDDCYTDLHKKPPTIFDPAKLKSDACTVCFVPFDGQDAKPAVLTNCFHENVCTSCFSRYIAVRIASGEVHPCLPCPDAECTTNIHPRDLLDLAPFDKLLQFGAVLLAARLAQSDNWVACANDNACRFGFLVEPGCNESKTCRVCDSTQLVSHRSKLDNSWAELLKAGIMRACPKCSFPTSKDHGMCNAMSCHKCGVWWNWRSRRTASTLRELKADSRRLGTLWEPGELAYQQQLQRNNPAAFKKLLESNGIKYDPNFVRGQS